MAVAMEQAAEVRGALYRARLARDAIGALRRVMDETQVCSVMTPPCKRRTCLAAFHRVASSSMSLPEAGSVFLFLAEEYSVSFSPT